LYGVKILSTVINRDLKPPGIILGDTCAGYFIGDVIRRETQTYEAVLKSIAAGIKTPQSDEIRPKPANTT